MKISAQMDPAELACIMDPNGQQKYSTDQAGVMRSLIVSDARAYGWLTPSDIEDPDWWRMLDEVDQTPT